MRERNLPPIDVTEGAYHFQIMISAGIIFQNILKNSTKRVLEIMLKNNLLTEAGPEKVCCGFQKSAPFFANFILQIGNECANDECAKSCLRNLSRIIENENEITGYESRNPDKNQAGGSIKLSFRLIFQNDESIVIAIYGASSGLKEWENLALLLGTFYHAKLFKSENDQIKEIVRQAELAVKNDPWAQPRGMKISQYLKKVFEAIDGKLAKAA